MNNYIIKIDNFSFSIDSKNILKNISLTVNHGDYVSIIGPNGAGKSTLLKCIIRIYTGGTGEINIDGRSLHSYRQKELAKLISYVPQSEGRNLEFSVYEFVMMGRYPYLNPFSSVSLEDKKAVHEALLLTETVDLSDRSMNTLSGGEKQNVLIAAAIAQGSKILLLDEPTTFLDPKHQSDISRTLKKVNQVNNITIVSVTHDINSATLISDNIIVLKEGSVAFSGKPEEVMKNQILRKIYDKSFIFVNHPVTGLPMIVPDGAEK
jgi:iron complex transport system ATP-binding protein